MVKTKQKKWKRDKVKNLFAMKKKKVHAPYGESGIPII